jgi:hypothetical protein
MKTLSRKCPIHTFKIWAHKLAMIVFMLDDLHKKQIVGLICPIDRISDEPTPTSVDKRLSLKT